MQHLIKRNALGVVMITVTGGVYGMLMDPTGKWVVVAVIGAFFGGLVAAGLFGHQGRAGWGLATLGACVATALGAGLAGGLIYFPDGVWIAPILVANFPTEALLAGPVWLGLMVVTHLVMRKLRSVA